MHKIKLKEKISTDHVRKKKKRKNEKKLKNLPDMALSLFD